MSFKILLRYARVDSVAIFQSWDRHWKRYWTFTTIDSSPKKYRNQISHYYWQTSKLWHLRCGILYWGKTVLEWPSSLWSNSRSFSHAGFRSTPASRTRGPQERISALHNIGPQTLQKTKQSYINVHIFLWTTTPNFRILEIEKDSGGDGTLAPFHSKEKT